MSPFSLTFFTRSLSYSLTHYPFSLLLLLCLWPFSLGLCPTRVGPLASSNFLLLLPNVSRTAALLSFVLGQRLLLTLSLSWQCRFLTFFLLHFQFCSPLFVFLLSPVYAQIYPLTQSSLHAQCDCTISGTANLLIVLTFRCG